MRGANESPLKKPAAVHSEYALLCGRLLTDSRVPTAERALVAGAIVYAIIPFDLIPDMIPLSDRLTMLT